MSLIFGNAAGSRVALIASGNAAYTGRHCGGEFGAQPLQPLVDLASPVLLVLLDRLVDISPVFVEPIELCRNSTRMRSTWSSISCGHASCERPVPNQNPSTNARSISLSRSATGNASGSAGLVQETPKKFA